MELPACKVEPLLEGVAPFGRQTGTSTQTSAAVELMRCPAIDAMGAEIEAYGMGLVLRQPLGPAVRADKPEGGFAQGAIVALFDHALGCAIGLDRQPMRAVTTLDLRVDWIGSPTSSAPVEIRTSEIHFRGNVAVASATATHIGSSQPFAIARGQFVHGILPGGSTLEAELQRRAKIEPALGDVTNFTSFLGARVEGSGWVVEPEQRHIGAVAVSAYHGGLVASIIDAVARAAAPRMAGGGEYLARSLAIQFLRPSIALSPLYIDAHLVRAGRTAATVDAVVRQDGPNGRVTARGSVAFQGELE